jgi:hypothetical protein
LEPACFALSGLGVGLAGIFPRFLYDNPAHRASVWAMIVSFVFSTGYVIICVSIFLLGWLAYLQHSLLADQIAVVGAIGFAVLSLATGFIPISIAERRLSKYEWNYN